MASAATPRNEIENKLRMGLLIHRSNDVLQDVLSTQLQTAYQNMFDPTNGKLFDILANQNVKHTFLWLKKRNVLNASQMNLLYPSGSPSTTITLNDLDITLTVVLLRNITTLNPKASWENPGTNDTSMEAQIGRVKKHRNNFSHGGPGLTDTEFQTKFNELKSLLLSLSPLYTSDEYDKLLIDPLHAPEAPCDLLSINLPNRIPQLKGREDLVQEILGHVAGDTQLILLTGMGGIGKTSTAIEVGHRRQDVLYFDMRENVNLESVKLSLVRHYQPTQFLADIYKDYQNQFIGTLSSIATDILLIFDNNDGVLNSHLQEFLQLLQDVMNSSKHVTLLCTSRESFSLLSHTTVTINVPPLDKTSSLKVLWGESSTTDSELEALGEIAERCGHNPLALGLLAPEIKLKTVDKVLDKMKHKKALSSLKRPNIPASQGMLTCLDMSYETLNPSEQRVFRGLYIFPVAFSLEEASAILEIDEDECEHVLDSLSSKSIISSVQNNYDIHPLLKEYAECRANTNSSEISFTQQRYCSYYMSRLKQMYNEHCVSPLLMENIKSMVPNLNNTASLLKVNISTPDTLQKTSTLTHLQLIADVFNLINLNREALSIYKAVAEGMKKCSEITQIDNVKLDNKIGRVLQDMGDYKEALVYYKKSLGVNEELLGPKHPDTAESYRNIGSVHQDMGDHKEAFAYYKKCLDVQEEVLGPKHHDIATAYNNVACVLRGLGDYEEAFGYFQKCVEVQNELLGLDHPETVTTLNNIGIMLEERGHKEEALFCYKSYHEVFERLLGPKHPNAATSCNNIGGVLEAMGDYKEALGYYEKSLGVNEELLGPKHRDTAASYNNIGRVLKAMGEHKKAIPYYKRCLAVLEELLGPKHLDTAALYKDIGGVLEAMGDNRGSLAYLRKCLDVTEELLGHKHPNTFTLYNKIGSVLQAIGENKEALAYYKKCLGVFEESLGPTHPLTLILYVKIGSVLQDMGNNTEALGYFKKCQEVRKELLGYSTQGVEDGIKSHPCWCL